MFLVSLKLGMHAYPGESFINLEFELLPQIQYNLNNPGMGQEEVVCWQKKVKNIKTSPFNPRV